MLVLLLRTTENTLILDQSHLGIALLETGGEDLKGHLRLRIDLHGEHDFFG